jgi:tetratricopeptide (TPR) repeat protein
MAAMALLLLAGGAEAAGVRAASHEGYGRLVFDFDRATQFQAAIEGDRLVVHFEQPFAAKLDSAVRALDGYVARASLSEDRRTATFSLKKSLGLRSFTNERSAVIDLLDQAPAATAAKQNEPASAARPTDSGPAAKPNESASAAKPAEAASKPAEPAAAKPTNAPAQAGEPAAKPAGEARAAAVAVRVGEHDDFTRLVFDWPSAVNYKVSSDGPVTHLDFDRPGSVDLDRVRRGLPRAIGSFDAANGAGGLALTLTIPAKANVRHFRNSANSVVLDVLAPPGAAPARQDPAATPTAAPVKEAAAAAKPAPAAASAVAAPAAALSATESGKEMAAAAAIQPVLDIPLGAEPLREPQAAEPARARFDGPVPTISLTAAANPQSIAIGVPWQPVPAAAIYARGGYLYMIFDRPAAFDFAALRRLDKRISAPEQLALAEGAALRFQIGNGYGARIARSGEGWLVTIRAEALRPDVELPVTADSASGAVAVGLSGALPPIAVPDPELGDILQVVPTENAARGVASARSFALFSVLPSLQGVVVAPRGDGVLVRAEPTRIMIGTASALAGAPSTIAPGTAKFFQFARWLQPEMDFTETRQLLERNAAEADEAHRAGARFELAQFYLARDHAIDALGILDLVTDTKPELGKDPAVKALRGAVQVALEHGREALADLADPRLDKIEGIQLWRAVATSETGDWDKANDLFKQAQAIPGDYPSDLRARFALAAAEAAVVTNEAQRAYRLLEPLAVANVPANVRSRSEYLRARALLAAEDGRSAMPILERLMSDGDPWARAHAEAIWVEQALKTGQITRSEAINRLERSRYAWTGDELEFNNLHRLAELYLEDGNPRNAFERFHSAVTYFPDRPEVPEIQKEMTEAFVSLYVGPSADKLPPLLALSLYDDYRDLTPAGTRGDDMIQHLADRLVQIDLLDRAADLLDYQIKNRLQGTDKARIGVRLAVVDLLDHNPQGALDGLDASEMANLPAEMATERQRLRARALLELGFADKALAALTDNSSDTDLLRAEILTRGQRWAPAAQVLWRVVGSPEDKSFNVTRSHAALNLGIALVLAGDREGIRKLDSGFGPLMAKGPDATAYAVLTRGMGDPVRGIDVGALTQRFQQLTQFQTAMDNYREKLRNTGLSTLN